HRAHLEMHADGGQLRGVWIDRDETRTRLQGGTGDGFRGFGGTTTGRVRHMNPAWWFGAAAVSTWVILALVPARPVGVRFAPVGVLALTVAVLRLLLIPMGYPIKSLEEWSAWVGAVLLGLGLIACRRFCLVRTTPQALREQIEWACRGLFLTCTEGTN